MKNINDKTEDVLGQVGTVLDGLFKRTEKINFDDDVLGENALNDLRLHLGYAKAYSDAAKVRLQYHKMAQGFERMKSDDDEE